MSMGRFTTNRTMSLSVQILLPVTMLVVFVLSTSVWSYNSKYLRKFLPYPHSFAADEPSKRAIDVLSKNLIGDDGRVYACSGKDFFAFERNGSIAWTVYLNYTCNPKIAPVHGGSTKIYLVAENRVLKIYPRKFSTSEAAVELFFGPREVTQEPGEIIGISASIFSSVVLVNVKNRGVFAYRLHGQLIWSAGPVLYQHGYRQGCKKNITECYFTSALVIDHCEASVIISNTLGELYSLSVRGPYFKWIQDLSSFGNTFTITTGNNGRLYVTIPDKALVLALDVATGNLLWQGSIGPLSSADYEPIVDANGWITFGSLDGYLYSFSPTGALRKFPKLASLNSVIQVNPVLDCSGDAVYVSQTEMEAKTSQTTAEYTHVSALKPKTVVFTILVPSSGFIVWSESDPSNSNLSLSLSRSLALSHTRTHIFIVLLSQLVHDIICIQSQEFMFLQAGKFLFKLSQSDLQHFLLDERTLLAFFAVSRNGNPLPCRSTRQKLASSCSQMMPKSVSIYTGNERAIVLFLLIESVLLVLLSAVVKYCCIFWKKKKLQALDLGKFLEKRRSLQSQKKTFDKMITELEKKASEETIGNEELENLSDLVKERDGIRRKLSTTYSLGRDYLRSSRSKSTLPLYNGKTKSYSFQGSKKESVTIFHTLSENTSTSDEDYNSPSMEDDSDEEFDGDEKGKGKGKAVEGERCSSDYEEEEYSLSGKVMGSECRGRRSLRRRTMSLTN